MSVYPTNTDPINNNRPPTNTSNPYSLKEAHTDVVPVGCILPFMGSSAPPYYLMCNGQTFDTTKFNNLFAILGRNTVPDLRGKTMFGREGSQPQFINVSTTGGSINTALDVNNLPRHTHTGNADGGGQHTHNANSANHDGHAHGGATSEVGDHTHSGATANAGSHTHRFASRDTNEGDGNGDKDTLDRHGEKDTGSAGDHAHNFNTHGAGKHAHNFNTNSAGAHSHAITVAEVATHTHRLTIDQTGSSSAFQILPPYYTVNYIIKAFG